MRWVRGEEGERKFVRYWKEGEGRRERRLRWVREEEGERK